MFEQAFTLTEPYGTAAGTFSYPPPEAGVYDYGLLTILDQVTSTAIGEAWSWLLKPDAKPLACTAFGETFFWSDRHPGVHYLDPQRVETTFVDRDIRHFLDGFLPIPGVKEKVLRAPLCQSLVARHGPLNYGCCFIAKPWQSLGGSGAEHTFGSGDVVVYASLTSQNAKTVLDARRMGR